MGPLAAVASFALIGAIKPQSETRLKGLDAIEIYLVTVPKEFATQTDVPNVAFLRSIADHRLTADHVPTVSFLAVGNDAAKQAAYDAKKKGHLIIDVQIFQSGNAVAYNVTVEVVEDAKLVRTGAPILAPIWSRSAIGIATSANLTLAIRNQVVDDIDELAADWSKRSS